MPCKTNLSFRPLHSLPSPPSLSSLPPLPPLFLHISLPPSTFLSPPFSHIWSSLRSNHPGSSGRLSNRGRIWLRRRGGGARGLIARWPVIPASEVPDDLVDQAMSVLQDKSRDMVIRELQRTVSAHIRLALNGHPVKQVVHEQEAI